MSIEPDRQGSGPLHAAERGPEPEKLKASPKGEALLTSEAESLSVLTRREAPC